MTANNFKFIDDYLGEYEDFIFHIEEIKNVIEILIFEYLDCKPIFEKPETYLNLLTNHTNFLSLANMTRDRLDFLTQQQKVKLKQTYDSYFKSIKDKEGV